VSKQHLNCLLLTTVTVTITIGLGIASLTMLDSSAEQIYCKNKIKKLIKRKLK